MAGGLTKVIAVTLQVSLLALLFSAIIALPLGTWLGLGRFRGRAALISVVHTLMGLPPVVAGVMVYLLLTRNGPFGNLDILFTPTAMVIAQTLIATPIVAGLVMSAVSAINPDLRMQLHAIGATTVQSALAVLREARAGIVVALMAGFGRLISEVGAVMLVGGNVEGQTRTLTTAVVLETRQGHFDTAIALGLVLLGLSFAANAGVLWLQRGRSPLAVGA